MSIKLVAVDVDDTLLNNRKELTPAVRKAIEDVKARGIWFTIATGRDIRGLQRFQDILSPVVPVITYNGAEIRMSGSGELLSATCLAAGSALEIVRRGLEIGFSVIVWSKGILYIGQPGLYSRGYSDMYGIRERELTEKDIASLAEQGITKVIWAGERDQIGKLEQAYRVSPIPGSDCCTSDPSYLEFMAEGVNKGAGLRIAAGSLSLSSDEVMAVGDGHNDLPMLRWAGLSVAMGNASEEVKSAAGYVTDSCEEDGLAKALRRFLLQDRNRKRDIT